MEGRVLGSLRILPSLGPTMFRDVFPEIFAQSSLPAADDIMEVSRFCVDSDAVLRSKAVITPNAVTRTLLEALSICMTKQKVRTLIGVHDLMMERILRTCGWQARRIGQPICTDTGLTTVASAFDVPTNLGMQPSSMKDGLSDKLPPSTTHS
ncbi:acyl-homoserine-lactone synthase [Phaeobacter sp.]|uniref:acyl-homoserine-lactone synthase n=1 Tax=Phaeobacter sp. TaxID=1902409 RepID=UPI0025EA84BF|nr:acyl-homoserine-lactone synthase [Phaeobacter sp.]